MTKEELEKRKERVSKVFHAPRQLSTDEKVDTLFESLAQEIKDKNAEISSLSKQLAEFKAEVYKDKELAKVKEERDRAVNELARGFGITTKQSQAIGNWTIKHDAEVHHNPEGYHGVSGGGYEYSFYPTAIGTFGECICCTCARLARREAATADTPAKKKNGYDEAVYSEYMKEHDAIFSFDDM